MYYETKWHISINIQKGNRHLNEGYFLKKIFSSSDRTIFGILSELPFIIVMRISQGALFCCYNNSQTYRTTRHPGEWTFAAIGSVISQICLPKSRKET